MGQRGSRRDAEGRGGAEMSAPAARPTSSLRGAEGGSEAGQGPPGNPEQYAGHSGLRRFARNDGGKVNHLYSPPRGEGPVVGVRGARVATPCSGEGAAPWSDLNRVEQSRAPNAPVLGRATSECDSGRHNAPAITPFSSPRTCLPWRRPGALEGENIRVGEQLRSGPCPLLNVTHQICWQVGAWIGGAALQQLGSFSSIFGLGILEN